EVWKAHTVCSLPPGRGTPPSDRRRGQGQKKLTFHSSCRNLALAVSVPAGTVHLTLLKGEIDDGHEEEEGECRIHETPETQRRSWRSDRQHRPAAHPSGQEALGLHQAQEAAGPHEPTHDQR